MSRWSRRKQEAREKPLKVTPEPAEAKPMPELPPIDKLGFESDFTGFMDTRVDEAVRRIALKKLFSDPRFNITDGLDDYAEDYAALEDLPAAIVDKLQHARRTLRGPDPEDSETPDTQIAQEQPEHPAQEQREPTQLAEEQLEQPAQPEQQELLAGAASPEEQDCASTQGRRNS
ncbi:MAG: DUF3306 domain-containing protein [Burkholderiales bacterium]|nr:DUF3306 domain-containing protein [Burkholderiales bacterium]